MAATSKRRKPHASAGTKRAGAHRPAGQAASGVRTALALLERHASRKTLEGYARYGITVSKAYGVPMGTIQKIARGLGRDHALAEALWRSGWYEARLLAAYVDEPARVTPAQMDRWCRDFDNWGVCDTVCFVLFDRTPHALRKVVQWAPRKDEFVRRAAFALLASAALHDKTLPDAALARCLPLAERAACDERNFVKKGVSWGLRVVGRRSPELHAKTVALGRRLARAEAPASRWVGRDVLRDLNRPAVTRRLAARSTRTRA